MVDVESDGGPNPWFSNPVWADAAAVRAHRMDRERHLWVGEWKDPEPPTAGHAAAHDLKWFPVPVSRRGEWSDWWACRRCRMQVYAAPVDGGRHVWGRALDVECAGDAVRR